MTSGCGCSFGAAVTRCGELKCATSDSSSAESGGPAQCVELGGPGGGLKSGTDDMASGGGIPEVGEALEPEEPAAGAGPAAAGGRATPKELKCAS